MSNGNITLISSISGLFTISGYQLQGCYQSTKTVAMIGIFASFASLNLSWISIMPDNYYVGNSSSFLLSTITSSNLTINNISIIIGNSSNYLKIGSIVSSDSANIYYQFGGVLAVYTFTNIEINSLLHQSFIHVKTDYVSISGFLIGYSTSSNDNITINNICFQQNMTSSISQQNYTQFGILGNCDGKTRLLNLRVSIYAQGKYFINVAIIGVQTSLSTEMSNIVIVMIISHNDNLLGSVAALISYMNCENFSILNTTVLNSNISSYGDVSGLIGYSTLVNKNITILNSTVFNSTISAINNVTAFVSYFAFTNVTISNSTVNLSNISANINSGGFIGYGASSNVTINNSTISTVRITGIGNGFIIGCDNLNTYHLTNSKSIGTNYIGGTVQGNCPSFTNALVPKGC
ncbi:Hypothetical_protein [Hexamita inflata]|uniref:Hypothetical_protein n=1 Tax=Hexamita inflata TaxID=28002 RepID=A0AA86UC30_9EUKA|nr:Hypothetical protein HINF_LOCUS23928 [Hexamita inflata]